MEQTERQVGNWLLGFTMGMLVVLGGQKLLNDKIVSRAEDTRAIELVNIYKQGRSDALITNPVSFELEHTCLEIWANKQPVESK
jgi:hypothetical protein